MCARSPVGQNESWRWSPCTGSHGFVEQDAAELLIVVALPDEPAFSFHEVPQADIAELLKVVRVALLRNGHAGVRADRRMHVDQMRVVAEPWNSNVGVVLLVTDAEEDGNTLFIGELLSL